MRRAYFAIGAFIGDNLAWLVPLSIFPGILLPQIFGPLNNLAPAMFACMAFQGALSNHLRDVKGVFTKPALLVIAYLMSQFAFPVLAYLGAHALFGDDPAIMSGIVAVTAAPVATTCMIWTGLYGGNVALGLTATLLTSFLAPFTVPLTLQLLVGAAVHIDAVPMMLQLLFMVVIPVIIGMAITERTDGWGEDVLAPKLAPVAFAFMLIINMANASTLADIVWGIGLTDVFVFLYMLGVTVLFYLLGLAISLLLGLDVKNRVAMSFSIGMKNISSASTLATAYLPAGANLPILTGLLYQATIAAVIGQRIGVPDTETTDYEEVEGAGINLQDPGR